MAVAMVPDDQHTQYVSLCAEQEVVGEPRQICTAQVVFTHRERTGPLRRANDELPQFAVNSAASSAPATVR